MMSSQVQQVSICLCLLIFALECVTCSEEGCYQYRRKANVTIDTDQCLWENYTEPNPKKFCLESCFQNKTVRIRNMDTPKQICFVKEFK